MNFKGTVGFGEVSPRQGVVRHSGRLVVLAVLAAGLVTTVLPRTVLASAGVAPPKQNWTFTSIFGQFDPAAVKRGAEVAVGSCMACHSIKYIKFDQLQQFGFTEAEVKTLAESQGHTKKDKMTSPLDPTMAKESFGVEPPDLSLMTKARKGYEDYVFGILTGYLKPEETAMVNRIMADNEVTHNEALEVASALHLDAHHPEKMKEALKRVVAGENFNKYFPGHFFAMPQPLNDGSVTYRDGTDNTQVQLARDVVTFLAWAAEPTATERKALGFKVILYLLVLTVMLYAVKRRIWSKIDH